MAADKKVGKVKKLGKPKPVVEGKAAKKAVEKVKVCAALAAVLTAQRCFHRSSHLDRY